MSIRTSCGLLFTVIWAALPIVAQEARGTLLGIHGSGDHSRVVLNLPLKDGTALTMATLAPGVTFMRESTGSVRQFDTSSPSQLSVDGTRIGSNEFQIDGAPNMQGSQVAYRAASAGPQGAGHPIIMKSGKARRSLPPS